MRCMPNETSQDPPWPSSPPSPTWKAETSWVWAWIQMAPWAGQQLLFRLQANAVCEDSKVYVSQLLNDERYHLGASERSLQHHQHEGVQWYSLP